MLAPGTEYHIDRADFARTGVPYYFPTKPTKLSREIVGNSNPINPLVKPVYRNLLNLLNLLRKNSKNIVLQNKKNSENCAKVPVNPLVDWLYVVSKLHKITHFCTV